MKKFTRFIFGVICGAFLGSTIAFLFTPSSGEETREVIINRFQAIKNQFQQAMSERRNELEQEIENFRKL